MPALLLEYLLFFIDIGVQNRVHIDIHKIPEIPVICAGNGINGLIRIGHGVQKGIEAALCKLYKGVLYRELSGAAENGVLEYMGSAAAVFGGRAETHIENLILIVIFKEHDPGTGLSVTEPEAS